MVAVAKLLHLTADADATSQFVVCYRTYVVVVAVVTRAVVLKDYSSEWVVRDQAIAVAMHQLQHQLIAAVLLSQLQHQAAVAKVAAVVVCLDV